MPTIQVLYFAGIREQLGRDNETMSTPHSTPREVWRELCKKESIDIEENSLRAAINEEFAEWDDTLKDGDLLVFIPPVAGG